MKLFKCLSRRRRPRDQRQVDATGSRPGLVSSRPENTIPDSSTDDPRSEDIAPEGSNVDEANQAVAILEDAPQSSSPLGNLWNTAFENIKGNASTSALAKEFEEVLSKELETGDPNAESSTQADHPVQQLQIQQAAKAALKRTEREYKSLETIGEVLNVMDLLHGTISPAVQAAPHAALPWAGISIALRILTNPAKESKAHREGVEYVIQRMKWYCEFEELILKDYTGGLIRSVKIRELLESSLISLYGAIILFLCRSVCSYHRKTILRVLRDTVKLDDWEGSIRAVKSAEETFRSAHQDCGQDRAVGNLDQLLDATKIEIKVFTSVRDMLAKQIVMKFEAEDNACYKDLRLVDSRSAKIDIELAKGPLLEGSYDWVLRSFGFAEWGEEDQGVLWIKGGPGKGKTMLMCGILDSLKSAVEPSRLVYFFCKANEPGSNNFTAVLRGIIFFLVRENKRLIKHVREEYDSAGKGLFEGPTAWVLLSRILEAILQDTSLGRTVLVIDALDECQTDQSKLLKFIASQASNNSSSKWIVSGRDERDINAALQTAKGVKVISLNENTEDIGDIVTNFVQDRVSQLPTDRGYDDKSREDIQRHLLKNSNDTFLWVSLVIERLRRLSAYEALQDLDQFPAGLGELYERMLIQICQNKERIALFQQILACAFVAKRPLKLEELVPFITPPSTVLSSAILLKEQVKAFEPILKDCGSFLSVRDGIVYLVHQSVKDFLSGVFENHVQFAYNLNKMHYTMFSRSLRMMTEVLMQDICKISDPGSPASELSTCKPDLLSAIQYACAYGIDHLISCGDYILENKYTDLLDNGSVHMFFQKKYLYFLEAVSILQCLPQATIDIGRLHALLEAKGQKSTAGASELYITVYDAHRFILYSGSTIEQFPLQAYVSALIFSPTSSITRKNFIHDIPKWVEPLHSHPARQWDACLQTFDHQEPVFNAIFSPNGGKFIANQARGSTKIWEVASGRCLHVLPECDAMAFSPNGEFIALAIERDNLVTIMLWEIDTGIMLQSFPTTVKEVDDGGLQVSLNGKSVLVVSFTSLSHWQIANGQCLRTIPIDQTPKLCANGEFFISPDGHGNDFALRLIASGEVVHSVSRHNVVPEFQGISGDGQLFAIKPEGATNMEIRKICNGELVSNIALVKGHGENGILCFSQDNKLLASASRSNKYIKVFELATGRCFQQLLGHQSGISSIAFSYDGNQLLSSSWDCTTKLWSIIDSGECLDSSQSQQPTDRVGISPEETVIAATKEDGMVELWNISSGMNYTTNSRRATRITTQFSEADKLVFVELEDRSIQVLETSGFNPVQTFQGPFEHMVISPNGQFIATSRLVGDEDEDDDHRFKRALEIWDTSRGECLRKLLTQVDNERIFMFSPDANVLVCGGYRTFLPNCLQLYAWNITGAEVFEHTTQYNHRWNTFRQEWSAHSHDSKYLITPFLNRGLELRTLPTGSLVWSLDFACDVAVSGAFSHDDKTFASVCCHQVIKIWDIARRTCLRKIQHSGSMILDMSFDPTDSYLRTRCFTVLLDTNGNRSDTLEHERAMIRGVHFVGRRWISWNGKNLVHPPTDRQSLDGYDRNEKNIILPSFVVLAKGVVGVQLLRFQEDLLKEMFQIPDSYSLPLINEEEIAFYGKNRSRTESLC
ncbi:Vegetative incompatibility protein HET-E-1 [Cladobotryum mycophilum]|uniref:Vegetative incompatibility protein HET-E-1 n=1 Tax=Cladobotryum mycophilum TaxID=491253 RepID=A0ABR0SS02_9HYPO